MSYFGLHLLILLVAQLAQIQTIWRPADSPAALEIKLLYLLYLLSSLFISACQSLMGVTSSLDILRCFPQSQTITKMERVSVG